jgi:hypothetical protein
VARSINRAAGPAGLLVIEQPIGTQSCVAIDDSPHARGGALNLGHRVEANGGGIVERTTPWPASPLGRTLCHNSSRPDRPADSARREVVRSALLAGDFAAPRSFMSAHEMSYCHMAIG